MLYGKNEGSFRDFFRGLEKLVSGETKITPKEEPSGKIYSLDTNPAYSN